MNYDHLFKKRKTDSGYGLPQMSAQEKLSVYNIPKACGIHCLLFTVNAWFSEFIYRNFPVRASSAFSKTQWKNRLY